jgi:hypothetical protein
VHLLLHSGSLLVSETRFEEKMGLSNMALARKVITVKTTVEHTIFFLLIR